jgi:hypothetical protein
VVLRSAPGSPAMKRPSASIRSQSIANRCALNSDPLTLWTAPRWTDVVAQQPFVTTQPEPVSGGDSRTGPRTRTRSGATA